MYRFFYLLFTLLFSTVSFAEGVNILYAGDVKETVGNTEVTLPIYLNNAVSITSVQFDLYLPEGVEVAYSIDEDGNKNYASAVTQGADRFVTNSDHVIVGSVLRDGVIRFVLFSYANQSLVDCDSQGDDIRATVPLLNIKLKLPEDMGVGYYDVGIQRVVLSGYLSQETTRFVADNTLSTLQVNGKSLVTFVVADEVICSCELPWGSEIVGPKVDEREGYTFAGWQDIDEFVPDHDVTYTSDYVINTYTVTYMYGDEVVHTDDVQYGEAIPPYVYVPEDTERYTYSFLGWVDAEGCDVELTTMPSNDLVVYAALSVTDAVDAIKGDTNSDVFTLQGNRACPSNTLNRGIYIVGGRKVLVE